MSDRSSPDLISTSAAAELLGVTRRTITNYVATGRLTGYRTGPRLVRVDRAELAQLTQPIPTRTPGGGA